MLTRALVSVLAAGLAAVLMLAAGQQAALAGGMVSFLSSDQWRWTLRPPVETSIGAVPL